MGISTEILNIKSKITDSLTSLSDKNVDISGNEKSDNLIELIESIPYYACPNGTQWTQSNITEGDWHIVYGNGIYVACSTDASRSVYYSTDGINWTASNIAFRIYHTEALKYHNGIWVLGGIYYSTDGMTWMNNNIRNRYITNVEYSNGIWLFGSYYNASTALFYSTDGMTWTSTGIGGNLYFLKRINKIWFACLNNILYCSEDGVTWNQCLTFANVSSRIIQIIYAKGIYLTYDADIGLLYYSIDGITWKLNNSIRCTSMKSLEYADGLFVASTDSGLQYSTDGINWIQSNITSSINNEIYYINDVWFAYSHNGTYTNYYSLDGMNWFMSKLNVQRIVQNNHGIWLTCSGGVIQYSLNYIDWNIALRNVFANELLCEDNIWLASYAMPYNYGCTVQSNMGIWYSKVWEQPVSETEVETETETIVTE